MKDLGPLHYNIGFEVHQFKNGLFLNQTKYVADLLTGVHMNECKFMAMAMAT